MPVSAKRFPHVITLGVENQAGRRVGKKKTPLLHGFEGALAFPVELLNAAVCLTILIYKEPEMKLGSVCRADRAQSNVSTLRSLVNFHIELAQFC